MTREQAALLQELDVLTFQLEIGTECLDYMVNTALEAAGLGPLIDPADPDYS